MKPEFVRPDEIEKQSFRIIESELGNKFIPDEIRPVVMRAIHTTADLDYADILYFSENAVNTALSLIKSGAVFVTDTNMAKAGINNSALMRHNCESRCFMADADIAENARRSGTTRAYAAVDKAALIGGKIIYAVGNAPTALLRICEHIENKTFCPDLVIGVPVGFVNVVQSKEMLISTGIPCIVSRGRKGGSNVAAAICNALLYMADGKK